MLQVDGHHGAMRTPSRVLQSGFYWPTLYDDARSFLIKCERYQRTGILTRRLVKRLQWTMDINAFDIWEVSLIWPFPMLRENRYILTVVDYVSHWAEATSMNDKDHLKVERFLTKHILRRFGTPIMPISDFSMEFSTLQLDALMEWYELRY